MEMTGRQLIGLPQVDPLDAEARGELLAALNGCIAGGSTLRAGIIESPPEGLAWFVCRGGPAFAPELLDGALLRLDAADTARAAEALDAMEPVLRALETALGIELEPQALEPRAAGDAARMLRVASGDGLRLYLSLPLDLSLTPCPAPFAPDLLHHVPLPVTMTIAGPRLSPVDAADLGPGDLVLLGPGPLAARLEVPGKARLPGRYDPAAATFRPLGSAPDQIAGRTDDSFTPLQEHSA